MKIHKIKIEEKFVHPLLKELQNFIILKDSRKIEIGDFIQFEFYWKEIKKEVTATFLVKYIISSNSFPDGIKKGYSVVGTKKALNTFSNL